MSFFGNERKGSRNYEFPGVPGSGAGWKCKMIADCLSPCFGAISLGDRGHNRDPCVIIGPSLVSAA